MEKKVARAVDILVVYTCSLLFGSEAMVSHLCSSFAGLTAALVVTTHHVVLKKNPLPNDCLG